METYAVKSVLRAAPLRPGSVMLCECADGCLRVFLDDAPMLHEQWCREDEARATAVYEELKAGLTAGR